MIEKQATIIRLARVLRYNRNRIEKAMTIFPPDQRPLFSAIPFLLHVNHPDFPGFVDDVDLASGLAFFSYRPSVQQALYELFPQLSEVIDDPKPIWPKRCYIESLSLMGSIGTAAQSDKSDLDYWVCVDGNIVKDKRWDLLQQKLTLIEQWAWDVHRLEVHFFLSDIEKVLNNDFGAADGESAGSAQPTFLKNEYYSTTILITGKIPFWWLTSRDCTDEEYKQQYEIFKTWDDPDPKYFLDLGNVAKLNTNEMFGATIWQLTKAMDSPFKSVLKMAKLEVCIDEIKNNVPLCNVLKDRVHQGVNMDKDLTSTDPYTLMFDTIISYYEKHNPKFLELFKACLYIKSDCPLTGKKVKELDTPATFKRQVITGYVKSWGWKREKIESYDNVSDWEFQQVGLLGRQIHSFLIGCYRRLSAQLQGHEQLVTGEDMTVIGRKIDAFYSVKPGKIQYLKRAFETGLIQLDITITMELDLNFSTKQRWSAFRGRLNYTDTNVDNPCFLKQSSDPVDLVIWCIFNRIISSRSQFYLLQSQLAIKVEDINELMTQALIDFKPIRVSELSREDLLQPSQITHCVLVVNFSSHKSVGVVETVRVIYLTSWGEVYSLTDIVAFEKIRQQFESQVDQPVCRLFTPSRNNREILYQWIEELIDFEFIKVI